MQLWNLSIFFISYVSAERRRPTTTEDKPDLEVWPVTVRCSESGVHLPNMSEAAKLIQAMEDPEPAVQIALAEFEKKVWFLWKNN